MSSLDWNATINVIRESLPQTQFQNWFKPLRLIRYDETSVVLGVPSRFHEEWLRSHYSAQISQAIRHQTGCDLQLEFEILVRDENVEAALSPSATSSSPLTSMARPTLRVIDGNAKEPDFSPDIHPQQSEPEPEAPQLPPFSHPFFQLDFNQFSYQCAHLAVQGRLPVNPLIICAGVGMGKTHLLSEIGIAVHRTRPNARIRYTNSESFTAEMVQALRENNILTFKRKYRDDTDVLLFDDLQGIAGRTRTQEELLHIFNEITARGGQVAFTQSIHPQRLTEFIDPLKSRILSGLITEIKAPNFEERVTLLSRVCEHNRLAIDGQCLRSIVAQGQKDIRELFGTLLRIHLQSQLENKPLDSNLIAKEGWRREGQKESVTLDEIISLIDHNFGVPRNELVSKSRKSVTTWARQVAMFLARHFTLLPLEEIGKSFGRDHATVIHAFQKVRETMESQPTRRYEVEFLMEKLQNRSPSDPTLENGPPNGPKNGSKNGMV